MRSFLGIFVLYTWKPFSRVKKLEQVVLKFFLYNGLGSNILEIILQQKIDTFELVILTVCHDKRKNCPPSRKNCKFFKRLSKNTFQNFFFKYSYNFHSAKPCVHREFLSQPLFYNVLQSYIT